MKYIMSKVLHNLQMMVEILISSILEIWKKIQGQIHIIRLGRKFRGRRPLPILGNVLELGRDSEAVANYVEEDFRQFGKLFRIYVGPMMAVSTAHQQDHEEFLSGTEYLKKGFLYEFLKPWLGTGLLISTGDKWRGRRKILTPAFHFKILDQFICVFNSCGDEFIRQMRKKAGGESFDVWIPTKLFTLDVICEATMGVTVNAQTNSNSDYVNAVKEMGTLIYEHGLRPWLYPEFIFRFSSLGRRFKECLKILHGMTNKVIRERKEELEKLNAWDTIADIDELGRRRRVAFLDLLLLAARDGSLTDADIREEVDTFMFEGHDTTAAAISFTLYLLSNREDVQGKLFEELKNVFGSSERVEPSLQQLSELKYMEMVIKESMRIYPPVPTVSREITRDYKLPASGLMVPKGSELFTSFIMLHRDEEVFPDPETFDPERFSADECAKRHPFAYLPFSAGPRNCIGQRFAMLEMKSVIAKVVWNFHIRPDPTFTPIIVWELILKTKSGLFLKLEERKRYNLKTQ